MYGAQSVFAPQISLFYRNHVQLHATFFVSNGYEYIRGMGALFIVEMVTRHKICPHSFLGLPKLVPFFAPGLAESTRPPDGASMYVAGSGTKTTATRCGGGALHVALSPSIELQGLAFLWSGVSHGASIQPGTAQKQR